MRQHLSYFIQFALGYCTVALAEYQPTWDSLDSRPNPKWWGDVKFAVSLHWGVYSVPSFSDPSKKAIPPNVGFSEWFWHSLGQHGPYDPNSKNVAESFFASRYGSDATYADLAHDFHADLFDADQWAQLFKDSGARMAYLTSVHHDGFSLYPSTVNYNWNSVDVGPGRDLIQAFTQAMRRKSLRVGLYHTIFQWFNPLYRGPDPSTYVTEWLHPSLREAVDYLPDDLLVDGEWEQNSTFWQTKQFLAWLFNNQTVGGDIAVNDRWGNECRGRHGGYYVCEKGGLSPFCDGEGAKDGRSHPWAFWQTIGVSWGYSRTEGADVYKPSSYFVGLLADTVANGGNLILNLGPDSAGLVPIAQEQLLRTVGRWLNVSGEAVFGTDPRSEAHGATGETVTFDSGSFPEVQAGQCVAIPDDPESNSTVGVAYLGKPDGGLEGCQKLCTAAALDRPKNGQAGSTSSQTGRDEEETTAGSCFSFSYFDGSQGAPSSLAGQCYGRTDPDWEPVWREGCSSGRSGVSKVAYTVKQGSDPVLYAIFRPYPNLGGVAGRGPDGTLNVTLTEPVVVAGSRKQATKDALLGSGLSGALVGFGGSSVAVHGGAGHKGLTLSLPSLPGWATVRGSGDAVAVRISGAQ